MRRADVSARPLSPQTGLEPRKLFNVVEFMMHDKDSSGTIDMDECMEILFRRFGKDQLEERTNECGPRIPAPCQPRAPAAYIAPQLACAHAL